MKSNADHRESRLLGSISTQSIRNLLPRSVSGKQPKTNSNRSNSKENDAPVDPNIQIGDGGVTPLGPVKPLVKSLNFEKCSARSDRQLDQSAIPSDPSVKVVVRIRPLNWRERGEDRSVRKVSSNSLSVGDRTFEFNAVVDASSTQEDIFQLVGVPLVKNSLAGFNTSILSYGQTGSGKTYTMWGPPSAMLEGHSPSSNQGIVPRIFQMLFSEFEREQRNSQEKQINFQCRCSFLEVYNEKIGDLLDPTQRNLQIRDDVKNGFYVENVTEEYVNSYDDVTQILVKGLSNRKVGATSINSKSSRSHIVFNFFVETWCKGNSSKCFSSSKTSRITLIDLAGSERNKLDDSRQCIKESRNVKRSLSHLGHLVHILGESSQSGRPHDVPYRSSCLTHLLQDSLGGNAKLSVICAISPVDKCMGETLSSLRFGLRAKGIQNNPVINEITEDDVNDLSDQIRQLKEELIKSKSVGYKLISTTSGHFKGRNARESLNHLRQSLNRSLILRNIDNDSDEEMHVDEDDVKNLCVQLDNLGNSCELNSRDSSIEKDSFEESSDAEVSSEHNFIENSYLEENQIEENHSDNPEKESHCEENGKSVTCTDTSLSSDPACRSSLSILPCRLPSVLQEPTLSESPRIEENAHRKSSLGPSNLSASKNHVSDVTKFSAEPLRQSVKASDHIRVSLRSSKVYSSPTESLAASLHKGLQIIDYHQRTSATNKSSMSFSFEHLAMKPNQAFDKADAGIQTFSDERAHLDAPATTFLCASCKHAGFNGSDQVQGSLNKWIVPVDKAKTPEGLTSQMFKDGEKALAEALRREKELEIVCAEQTAKIEQLNQLVEQYKHEREHNTVTGHSQEIRILHDGTSADGNATVEDLKMLEDENKILLQSSHILKGKNDLRELDGTDHEYNSMSYDLSERDALLKEIENLKIKLQESNNIPLNERSSMQLRRSCKYSSSLEKRDEELEKERQRWTEMESDWISLTDELRIDLESKRRHAENVEMELEVEKKVTQELDDVISRAVLGHARIVEHYAELQEKYEELLGKHRKITEWISEVKTAAAKAGAKGNGSRFAKALAAELSASRAEKERERQHLKKENKSLKMQLRDTAEAVRAAGELLVRLRESEEAVAIAEENCMRAQKEAEKVRKQLEKQKRKHAMEMVTMKQYLAESRLPESALRPMHWQDEDRADEGAALPLPDDDQAWRAEFGSLYRERY